MYVVLIARLLGPKSYDDTLSFIGSWKSRRKSKKIGLKTFKLVLLSPTAKCLQCCKMSTMLSTTVMSILMFHRLILLSDPVREWLGFQVLDNLFQWLLIQENIEWNVSFKNNWYITVLKPFQRVWVPWNCCSSFCQLSEMEY